jgi:hypothetical protein
MTTILAYKMPLQGRGMTPWERHGLWIWEVGQGLQG